MESGYLYTDLCQFKSWIKKETRAQLANTSKQGQIQAVSLGGGAISVIFASEVSLPVHYCKRDEV